jgi:hypothetical protein
MKTDNQHEKIGLNEISASRKPMPGNHFPLWVAVGHFIVRAPARLARTPLPVFLARLAVQPRDGADFLRVAKLSRRWLRLYPLRSYDTCYLRSLVLFRFIDSQGGDLCVHFAVDELAADGGRLHGHAWVSLNGQPLNGPASLAEGKCREIYRFSNLNGGSSTSGATSAAAMMRPDGAFPVSGPPKPV